MDSQNQDTSSLCSRGTSLVFSDVWPWRMECSSKSSWQGLSPTTRSSRSSLTHSFQDAQLPMQPPTELCDCAIFPGVALSQYQRGLNIIQPRHTIEGFRQHFFDPRISSTEIASWVLMVCLQGSGVCGVGPNNKPRISNTTVTAP